MARTSANKKDYYCLDVLSKGERYSNEQCERTTLKVARDYARHLSQNPHTKNVLLRRSVHSARGPKDISWWENGRGKKA